MNRLAVGCAQRSATEADRQVEDDNYREAVRMLFGLAPGTRRARLTDRRRQTADVLGYNVDHFRTRIEPEIVRALAEQVQRDLLRYKSRVKRAVNTLEPTGDTPRLTPEHLTAEERADLPHLATCLWATG